VKEYYEKNSRKKNSMSSHKNKGGVKCGKQFFDENNMSHSVNKQNTYNVPSAYMLYMLNFFDITNKYAEYTAIYNYKEPWLKYIILNK
jgi:hypothetical protein